MSKPKTSLKIIREYDDTATIYLTWAKEDIGKPKADIVNDLIARLSVVPGLEYLENIEDLLEEKEDF
jgi:hypothetical protein